MTKNTDYSNCILIIKIFQKEKILKKYTFNPQKGSVIMEYLLITVFTLVTGAATLNYIHSIVKSKIEKFSKKIDHEQSVEFENDEIDDLWE